MLNFISNDKVNLHIFKIERLLELHLMTNIKLDLAAENY